MSSTTLSPTWTKKQRMKSIVIGPVFAIDHFSNIRHLKLFDQIHTHANKPDEGSTPQHGEIRRDEESL
ncbi:hypothetical protein H0H87_003292, partial [Tephrocybe sp. NHM501043]